MDLFRFPVPLLLAVRLAKFEGDRVAGHQAVEKGLALFVRGHIVVPRCVLQRFHEFVAAMLVRAVAYQLVDEDFDGLVVRDGVSVRVRRGVRFPAFGIIVAPSLIRGLTCLWLESRCVGLESNWEVMV